VILEQLPSLGDTELRVLLTIARATLGYTHDPATDSRTAYDSLTYAQLQELTGRTPRALRKAVGTLIAKGWIEVRDENNIPLHTSEARLRAGQHHRRFRYRLAVRPEAPEKFSGDLGAPEKNSGGTGKIFRRPETPRATDNSGAPEKISGAGRGKMRAKAAEAAGAQCPNDSGKTPDRGEADSLALLTNWGDIDKNILYTRSLHGVNVDKDIDVESGKSLSFRGKDVDFRKDVDEDIDVDPGSGSRANVDLEKDVDVDVSVDSSVFNKGPRAQDENPQGNSDNPSSPPKGNGFDGFYPPVSKLPREGRQYVYPPPFEVFWGVYPRKVEKVVAYRRWRGLVKSGVDPDDLLRAAKHYAEYVEAAGTEERYIKHPSTFLNDDRWRDWLQPRPLPRKRGVIATLEGLYKFAKEGRGDDG